MRLPRKLLLWCLVSLGGLAILLAALRWGPEYGRRRWSNFLVGDPHLGSLLFQEKGCARCHAVNGVGGGVAPDLGFETLPESGVNQLVTAMWNHAPRMWERMRKEQVTYPELSYQDMAHLFAYLYTVRYVDEPGDPDRGRQLFEGKGCIECHSFYGQGGKIGPDLSTLGADTPIAWTQEMWNHAPAMEAAISKLGLPWPKFQGREMNNLLAYVRSICGGPREEFELLPANPRRGWQLFESKSCISCHSVKGEGGHVGPELGPRREVPVTMVQFAGAMWNHSPAMWREMQARNIPRPTFTGQEMADLVAFLQSIRYFEPGGSPQVGEVLFARRGCIQCHGAHGEGSRWGPALRVRGGNFTIVTFASELWRHGPQMYQRTQQLGLPWPNLVESDIGDLLAFLNTPPTAGGAAVKSSPSDNKQ